MVNKMKFSEVIKNIKPNEEYESVGLDYNIKWIRTNSKNDIEIGFNEPIESYFFNESDNECEFVKVKGNNDKEQMEYSIMEIFEFPIGTEFDCEHGTVIIDSFHGEKTLKILSLKCQVTLTDKWLKTKFKVKRKWKETSFIEALNAYNEYKEIRCEWGGLKYKFSNSHDDTKNTKFTDFESEERLMSVMLNGKWFVNVSCETNNIIDGCLFKVNDDVRVIKIEPYGIEDKSELIHLVGKVGYVSSIDEYTGEIWVKLRAYDERYCFKPTEIEKIKNNINKRVKIVKNNSTGDYDYTLNKVGTIIDTNEREYLIMFDDDIDNLWFEKDEIQFL